MSGVHPPRNPDYERIVRESFARQTYMATLGATLDHVGPGEVVISVPWSERMCQQNGFLHAGVLASVADSACGYAAFTLAEPGTDVLAVEFKINLLRPARGRRFTAKAHVLRAGRTLTAARADVYGEDGELIAAMQSTVIVRLGENR